MKERFSGYYRPTEEEFSSLWHDSTFVLDSSAILNLYRYSRQTSSLLIEILNHISDRLWLPHQVALEYQENRLEVIGAQQNMYEEIAKILQNTQDELATLLGRGHISIDVERVLKQVDEAFSSIRYGLDTDKNNHPELFAEDPMRDTISHLFDGKVGEPYPQELLEEIYKQGARRYGKNIPPGYKDDSKKGVKRFGALVLEDRYGDLILWLQVIDQARQSKRPIIFVTDDSKEDWWWQVKGKTIGPRPELITEMRIEADVPFYMYTPERFVHYGGKYAGIQVARSIIDEIQETSEATQWKDEITRALFALGGSAHLSSLYEHIQDNTARELPRSWQAIIRKNLQHYASNCEAFLGRDDLFVRLGGGYWTLKQNPQDTAASEERMH